MRNDSDEPTTGLTVRFQAAIDLAHLRRRATGALIETTVGKAKMLALAALFQKNALLLRRACRLATSFSGPVTGGPLVVPLSNDSSTTNDLLQRARGGDREAVGRLMQQHRLYLRRLVDVRMEPALRRRIDASEVVQDALLKAVQRIDDFLQRRPASFRLWLRRTALEQLIDVRRRHQAQKRNLYRDQNISDVSSRALAQYVLAGRPSEKLSRRERIERVRQAMANLSQSDCDILTMRHAEELSNGEIAELLEIDPKTASKRYGRALRRLSDYLAQIDDVSQ